MVSKEFAKYLEPLLFPVKLYELAHSDEVKSVFWSLDRIAVKLNTEILGKECFRPEIFNVADHKHVFRQLSYYGFTRTVREGNVWEFVHPHFAANDIDKVRTIKRKGKKNQNAITASDTKKVLTIIQSRRSSRLQNRGKERYPSLIESLDFKDESLSESLIVSQVEDKRRSLRGSRKRNFSSFFEEPVSEEKPVFDSLTASQAKKKPRTSRGRKKRGSASFSEDLLLKPENIFDSLVTDQAKEKPPTKRGRKKRDFSFCEDSLLKNEPIPDSLISSRGNEKPRAPRGRKKRCLSSFSDGHVLEQGLISESSIASHARNNPRANSTSRINNVTEESGLILKRSSSLQDSLNQNSSGKDLNLLKSNVKNEFDSLSQTGNSACPSVKEEIDTENKKPRRTYVRKKSKGGRRKKEEDPSYHATFKSDIEKYDFTAIAYNYDNCKYPQTRSCNLIHTKDNVQKCELDTMYVNNVSNAAFRPPVHSTYSEILNYQSMCEDVQCLNVSSEFHDIPYSNVKPVQFVKTELKVLQNDNPHLHQNLCNLVDVEVLIEAPTSHEKLDSLKFIDKNHKFFPDYSTHQHENKSGSRSVSIFTEVPNCKKGSETCTTPIERVKIEEKFEKNNNLSVSERPYDLEEVTIKLFKECITPTKCSVQQSLVDSIKNEHNYYRTNIAENCEISSSNLDSLNSPLNQNSSNDLEHLGPIKIKEENFGMLVSNVSKHFVLGSGYIWKPINRNSASDIPETNLVCSEKNMTSSLENTPNKLSISHVEDYSNINSNATAHQEEEKHSSFNITNGITGDSMNIQQASRTKKKNTVKLETNNVILNNSINSDSSQVCLWLADHSGFPQAISCDTPTKMVSVTYAVPQTNPCNAQVGMSDTKCVPHQINVDSSQHGLHTVPQTNPCNAQVGMSDTKCVPHQINVDSSQHGLHTYPILYKEDSYFSKVEVTAAQILECNSYKSQGQVPAIIYPVASCNETVMDTAMHSTVYKNQSVLENSSGDKTIMTDVTYPSFCQNQSALLLSKEHRNTRKKKKSTKPKELTGNFPEKKEHVMSRSRPNSFHHRRESVSWRNPIQGTSNSNIQASPAVGSAGSRNDLCYGNDYPHVKRLETEDTLPNLQESDIEILDLTDEILVLDNDDVFERKNDHSKIYVKPEIDEEDYTLPDYLRQKLVEYLSEQYISGKMTIDDIVCSENPYIKNYAFDAILLDIFRQK